MDTDKTKIAAIAQLKAGHTIESIASNLVVSPALVQEWSDTLPAGDKVSRELGAMTVQAAVEIVGTADTKKENSSDKLENELMCLALLVCRELRTGFYDVDVAMSLGKSAETVAKLYSAFFSKSSQTVNVDVTNTNSNQALTTFKDSLRH